jgi:hypothetical protein
MVYSGWFMDFPSTIHHKLKDQVFPVFDLRVG